MTVRSAVVRRSARGALSALLASLLLVLVACGAMPTSGEVRAGELAEDDGTSEVSLLANSPRPGSKPAQIVSDFIAAATSPAGGWKVAKQFLAPDAKPWNPDAVVMIDNAQRTYTASEDGTSVEMDSTWNGQLDPNGVLTEDAETPLHLRYSLKKVDGEWRITEAPPGIVLERSLFTSSVYGQYPLMFWDPTWTYLVPDVRWFPRALADVRIADALVVGPREELAPAVTTAFPSGTTVREGSVQVESGVARVSLSNVGSADTKTLGRMQAQLRASMRGASAVAMSIDSTLVSVPVAETASTAVDSQPVVLTKDAFGSLSGSTVTASPAWFDLVAPLHPRGIEFALGRDWAAVQDGNGVVVRAALRDKESGVLDDRAGLVVPTVDPEGYTWSAPAGQPDGLVAIADDGQRADLAKLATGLASVQAMQMSRDGTRLAVVGVLGNTPTMGFFTVKRDGGGAPTGLGSYVELLKLPARAVDVAWLDDLTVGAVVGGSTPVFVEQVIGGIVEAPSSLPDGSQPTAVLGANTVGNARVLMSDGAVFTRRGPQWSKQAEGVLVFATQLGTA